ncbi:MAG: glycogen synthase GlgA [Bacillota bacterium]
MERLRILFAASEAVPFAKTGGLADVAGTLPKELCRLGHDVRLVMPKYNSIPKQLVEKMEYVGHVYVDLGWRHQYCGVHKLQHDELTVYFIDNEYYFKRETLYGHFDEAEQFAFFSKAVLQILPFINFQPDIINCNDWQTGVTSLFLNSHFKNDDYYKNIKTVFTIHNLKYQGIFSKSVLPDILGLGWEYFTSDKIEYNDCVNFMKAGLVYSDIITTVSRTYADEIKHDFFGEGLNGVINSKADNLYGILNGIDYVENNPETDVRLYANYNSDMLEGKYINKKMLQRDLNLSEREDVPIIGIVSRLVDQKGFDLIARVFVELLELDIQMVVLGTGEYKYEEMFKWAAAAYPHKVSANLKYDSTLAQRIYAGSDIFLMPSLFEPCGLSQLFSLRYGTVPIVRETGGLNDTIKPYDENTGFGNGFTFSNYNAHDMLYTVKRAIYFYNQKEVWNKIIRNGMLQDFSWKKSAEEYIQVYLHLKNMVS